MTVTTDAAHTFMEKRHLVHDLPILVERVANAFDPRSETLTRVLGRNFKDRPTLGDVTTETAIVEKPAEEEDEHHGHHHH
jgi:hypothetical protein